MNFKEEFEISVRCPNCGEYYSIYVEKEDYWKWVRNEGYVQDIFHYLRPEEREILISGLCPTCWKKTFDYEDEYEDA